MSANFPTTSSSATSPTQNQRPPLNGAPGLAAIAVARNINFVARNNGLFQALYSHAFNQNQMRYINQRMAPHWNQPPSPCNVGRRWQRR
jgi:hypothetical protein